MDSSNEPVYAAFSDGGVKQSNETVEQSVCFEMDKKLTLNDGTWALCTVSVPAYSVSEREEQPIFDKIAGESAKR